MAKMDKSEQVCLVSDLNVNKSLQFTLNWFRLRWAVKFVHEKMESISLTAQNDDSTGG